MKKAPEQARVRTVTKNEGDLMLEQAPAHFRYLAFSWRLGNALAAPA